MEGLPYRAMPLPPAPPREWRPIVERSLAVFNGLILASMFVPGSLRGVFGYVFSDWLESLGWLLSRFPVPLAPLLGLLGFAGPWQRRVAAYLVLPSGLWWLLVGAIISGFVVWPPRPGSDLAPLRISDSLVGAGVIAMAVIFVAAGVLTIASAYARLRHRR